MNNFNYSSIPGELLYSNRRYLDEFGVEEPNSLNGLIQEWLYENYSKFADYEEFVTSIFNCAYCICTRALADSHIKYFSYLCKQNKKLTINR